MESASPHRRARAFTTPLTEKIRNPDSRDQFANLHLLAYSIAEVTPEAKERVRPHFTDEEWNELKFECEVPWYELDYKAPKWPHRPGTVFADFACAEEGGEFTFYGFWQVRDCPNVEIKSKNVRLVLATKLPHFKGYRLSRQEQKMIAQRVHEVVKARNYCTDDFENYIDREFSISTTSTAMPKSPLGHTGLSGRHSWRFIEVRYAVLYGRRRYCLLPTSRRTSISSSQMTGPPSRFFCV